VQNKLKLLAVAAENKNIHITSSIPNTTYIYADENQFKFILRNLISNAIKFSHTGGVVEIGISNKSDNGLITFYVKDNGVGIDKEMLPHIFEPSHLSTLGTANEKGTGIGLMLCKDFVIQNGGQIRVESTKEQGTTFFFSVRRSAAL
jgi:signal transduction histidine kinase